MSVADALPPSSTDAFERAAAAGMAAVIPVAIRDAVNPATAPAAFLPFLAAHESVDLWFSDWSDARKREMIAEAVSLGALKGTRTGSERFLSYVDAELLDVISYPRRFIMGRAWIGRTPIGHPPFVAIYLVKVETVAKPRTFAFGRSYLGRDFMQTPDRDPLRRALRALRVAKAPHSEYRVDFAHHRQISLDDGIPLDSDYRFGAFAPRANL